MNGIPIEPVLIVLVAVGLVTAGLVGAAVALVVNLAVYRRRFPSTMSSRDETAVGAETLTRPVLPERAEPTTPIHSAALTYANVASLEPSGPAPDARSLTSTLPDAPWDYQAEPPAQAPSQEARNPASPLPETPWESAPTSPPRPTGERAELDVPALPNAAWRQEPMTPVTPWPSPDGESRTSFLTETTWDSAPSSSGRSWSDAAGPIGSNGAGNDNQNTTHGSANGNRHSRERSDKPGRWGSDIPAPGGWGDLAGEEGATNHTYKESRSPEPPVKPDPWQPPDDEPPLWRLPS
jgi:hypothetical protein